MQLQGPGPDSDRLRSQNVISEKGKKYKLWVLFNTSKTSQFFSACLGSMGCSEPEVPCVLQGTAPSPAVRLSLSSQMQGPQSAVKAG